MTNMMLIDAQLVAHTSSTCEEVQHPTINSIPDNDLTMFGFVVCGDCEVR